MTLDQEIAKYLGFRILGQLLAAVPTALLLKGGTAVDYARESRTDPASMHKILTFISEHSKLVREDRGRYSLRNEYRSHTSRFRLMKYLDAYAAAFDTLSEGHIRPNRLSRMSHALARAYEQLSTTEMVWLPSQILKLPYRRIVEIGCGSAPVLRALARMDDGVRGYAVDSSEAMVRLAKKLVCRDNLSSQILVRKGSLASFANGSLRLPFQFDAVVLRSVLNSFFREGTDAVTDVLRELSGQYPDTALVVSDYYGGLGSQPIETQTATQDLVQVLSGQGIPPSTSGVWLNIYRRSGWRRILHRKDRTTQGIVQFLDVIVHSRS